MLLGGALVFATITAVAVNHYLQRREQVLAARLQARYQGKRITVVVPRGNLPAGALATSQDMATRAVPADLIYPSTVTLGQWPRLDGHRLSRAVYAGKPLMKRDFTPERKGDFATQLRAGTRAVTITVNPVNAIAGLLRPDDRVAILFLAHHQEIPLLHHVRVLAIGLATARHGTRRRNDYSRANFGTITLAVTPREAGELTLAERVGGLRVVLDPAHERPGAGLPRLTLASLYGLPGAAVGGTLASVQYIVGGGQGNRVRILPVGEPLSKTAPASGPAAALAHVATRTDKALSTLRALLRKTPGAVTAGVP